VPTPITAEEEPVVWHHPRAAQHTFGTANTEWKLNPEAMPQQLVAFGFLWPKVATHRLNPD
jgi:hypothetical protein